MLTRNVATYATVPFPQRAHAADEELTHPLARWQNSEPYIKPDAVSQHNRVESVYRTFELCVSTS